MDEPVNDSTGAKRFQLKADELFDRDNPGQFNQAMMELGACLSSSVTHLSCLSRESILWGISNCTTR